MKRKMDTPRVQAVIRELVNLPCLQPHQKVEVVLYANGETGPIALRVGRRWIGDEDRDFRFSSRMVLGPYMDLVGFAALLVDRLHDNILLKQEIEARELDEAREIKAEMRRQRGE